MPSPKLKPLPLVERIDAVLSPIFLEYDDRQLTIFINTCLDLLRESKAELEKRAEV